MPNGASYIDTSMRNIFIMQQINGFTQRWPSPINLPLSEGNDRRVSQSALLRSRRFLLTQTAWHLSFGLGAAACKFLTSCPIMALCAVREIIKWTTLWTKRGFYHFKRQRREKLSGVWGENRIVVSWEKVRVTLCYLYKTHKDAHSHPSKSGLPIVCWRRGTRLTKWQ